MSGCRQGLKEVLQTSAKPKDVELLAVKVRPDHVHLFVSAPPRYSPAELANIFKGVTGRRLRERCPEIKQRMPKRLWTRTYYVGAAGTVTPETIKKYIKRQREL